MEKADTQPQLSTDVQDGCVQHDVRVDCGRQASQGTARELDDRLGPFPKADMDGCRRARHCHDGLLGSSTFPGQFASDGRILYRLGL